MKPSEILLKAKELLVTKGWVKKTYICDRGYCLSGALSYATHGTREARSGFYKACDIVSKLINPDQPSPMYHTIETYNDLPYRTKEHVLDLLDKATAKAVELES